MRPRIFSLVCLLMTVMIVVAQSIKRQEYWIDSDYGNRQSMGTSSTPSATISTAGLSPGVHFFNHRAMNSNNEWGTLYRYMFFIPEQMDVEVAKVEYWIDNDYQNAVRRQVSSSSLDCLLSISGLASGLHFFNLRPINAAGDYGVLRRTAFFIPAEETAYVAGYEYWIDDDTPTEVSNGVTGGFFSLIIDVPELTEGEHTFSFRAKNISNVWGDVFTSKFTISGSIEATPYAVFNDGTLTFYYDNQRSSREGTTYDLNKGYNTPGWSENAVNITTVVFDASFANSRPTSTCYWFDNCKNLTNIQGIKFLNTSEVWNMNSMFCGCSSLTSLDVSNFNTAKVTNMVYMFVRCSSLTSLDVSNFNTANVTYMSSMFFRCSSLTSLDVSNFNTANVTDMAAMFYGCSSLTSLDVSNFNTANVTDMQSMFDGCSSLTSLDVSNFNTANVKSMRMMFFRCSSLTNLDVSNFNTVNATHMEYMFCECSSLTSLDVNNFNTANVTEMGSMFEGCSSLTSLDVSNFNTANATYMGSMFDGCSSLTSLDVSNFNTANVTNMQSMFDGCSSLTSLDVSNFNTANVTNMAGMFRKCAGLSSINVNGFDTRKVTTMDYMFEGCTKLASLDLSSFDTSALVDKNDGTFIGDHAIIRFLYSCTNLSKLTLGSSFTTTEEHKCDYVFGNCSSLKTVTFTGDIPASINSNFFKYIGTASAPATLDVPKQYKSNYAAKFSGNMFFGGYFTLGGAVDDDIITFADAGVKRICVENWDTNGDGELSKDEAAAVTTLGQTFTATDITSFTELQYFTGLTELADNAFTQCKKLTTLAIPKNVASMGESVFAGCASLTSLTIDEENNYFCMADGMLYSKDMRELKMCLATKSGTVKVNNSCKVIAENAFFNCIGLTYIELPSQLETIKEAVFVGCTSLSTLFIPATVRSIGIGCFTGCSKLENIYVDMSNTSFVSVEGVLYNKSKTLLVAYPGNRGKEYEVFDGVTEIAPYAFCMSDIEKVVLPASVTKIGSYGLAYCESLTDIYVHTIKPFVLTGNEFVGITYSKVTLYVPAGTKAKYEATDGWKNFTKIVEMETVRGDVDGDGKVSMADVVKLMDVIANVGVAPARYLTSEEQPVWMEIEPFTIEPDDSVVMLIDVNNPGMEVALVQFNIRLPEGLSVAEKNGKLDIKIAGRTTASKHELNAAVRTDGTILVYLIAKNINNTLSDTSGPVFSVALVADDSFAGGDIALEKQLFYDPSYKSATPETFVYTLNVGNSDAGPADVNGDGRLDVADVITLMGIIAGK